MLALLDRIPLFTCVIIALTLGLAPFVPEPHIWEKIKMLFAGTLVRSLDIFDLFFHGVAWILLGVKLARLGWLAQYQDPQH